MAVWWVKMLLVDCWSAFSDGSRHTSMLSTKKTSLNLDFRSYCVSWLMYAWWKNRAHLHDWWNKQNGCLHDSWPESSQVWGWGWHGWVDIIFFFCCCFFRSDSSNLCYNSDFAVFQSNFHGHLTIPLFFFLTSGPKVVILVCDCAVGSPILYFYKRLFIMAI